eukprot:TRINITY_DN13219_c0_g1_i2.p1 TRINITY_DN13219_c0_g1~~TRINITY_DN13219_c0_g1_i2.p1  ORF type:complete len:172 (+),score=19.23 TRINITY_DN13219_c0_g1_i2:365-880(+)
MDMPLTLAQIPPEEIAMAPKLLLEVLESPSILPGTTFLINACGYENSERKMNDGCVYIGTHSKSPDEFANDIEVPEKEGGMGHKHLVIKYSIETKEYFLKDLGEGTGTFIRIDRPLALKQGHIISFGDSHMAISIRVGGKIQLKFLDGPKTDQTLYSPLMTVARLTRATER